jgi:hypothetical protein
VKQELMHSKIGVSPQENKFLESIKGVKIINCATVALDQLFRRCMLKVGLRSQNLPNKEETTILHDHLRKNYGMHTIPEIDLAFELAITGQLDLDQKEVVCYENFSCLYLSGIINSYRNWASKIHRQIIKQPIEEKIFPSIDWREQVQLLLDQFIQGIYKPRLSPVEIYDTLVLDGFINALAYEAFLENANMRLRKELQKELTAVKCRIDSIPEDKIIDSADYTKHQELDRKLIEYRNGSRDAEVKLLSKQMAVYHYFSYLKTMEIFSIYTNQ